MRGLRPPTCGRDGNSSCLGGHAAAFYRCPCLRTELRAPAWLSTPAQLSAPLSTAADNEVERNGDRITGARDTLARGLGSLLALIFGIIGKNQIDRSGGYQSGRGMAIAGIVLGIVGLAGAILWFTLAVIAANSVNNGYGY